MAEVASTTSPSRYYSSPLVVLARTEKKEKKSLDLHTYLCYTFRLDTTGMR